MKHLILLLLFAILGNGIAWSQRNLFSEVAPASVSTADQRSAGIYNLFRRNPLVKDISFIKIDRDALKDESVSIRIKNAATAARKRSMEVHDNKEDYSWFGRLSDETGIFFTVMNGQVASKFYMGDVPCLIVPYQDDIHLLVTYNSDIDNAVCGTPHTGAKAEPKSKGDNDQEQLLSADDNCTMRVLWVVTAQAEPEIPMSLELAARMLQDESNLAYQQSQINLRMEIARVIRTNYAETTGNTSATAYGVTNSYPSDLINLSTGAGLLNSVPAARNLYNADVVVMVRSAATNSAQGFYGIAYGVPTDPSAINAGNAFALISTQFMIGGRFTFAHEIGHIQGARHDNHSANPVYGRGYVFSASGTSNRTIMAVGCGNVAGTGCRVQFFSNPNISVGGVPIGIANSRDNARRINETATQVLAHRITTTNLLLPGETFESGILARHLATQTISTNDNAVVALAGSRVSMRAGSGIVLRPGFRANSGSVFTAYINNCSYVPTTDQVAYAFNARSSSPRQEEVLSEDSDNAGFRVYPNPTTGTLSIVHPPDSKILSVIDMMGNTVIQKGIYRTSNTQLDLKGIPSGMYIIRVDGRKGIKVIKE